MKIIFIIVDAMRWDFMSGNGYPRPTTPNMDALAERSAVFERAYATINQTDMSLTSIFSGAYPLTHGLEQTAASTPLQQLNELNVWRIRYLPQLLQDAGFGTFGADWFDRWHQWGYDWYWSKHERRTLWLLRQIATQMPRLAGRMMRLLQRTKGSPALLSTKPGINAEEATSHAIRFLRERKKKDTYVMLHYWDAHVPYMPEALAYLQEMKSTPISGEDQAVEAILERLCKSDLRKRWLKSNVVRDAETMGDLIQQYCSALRTVDDQIGRLCGFLTDNGLMEESVIVITADHGENFDENGYFFEHSGVAEHVMHVPLIINFPSATPVRIDDVVTHVDILPTLLEYLGLPIPDIIDGQSLLPLMAGNKLYLRDEIYFQSRLEDQMWGIIADGKYKVVAYRENPIPTCHHCGKRHHEPLELYDLSADPAGIHSIATQSPDLADRLAHRLQETVGKLQARRDQEWQRQDSRSQVATYTAAEQMKLDRRLKDLGYIE